MAENTDLAMLTPAQVAELLQVTVRGLISWRRRGYGPTCYTFGKTRRYRAVEVDAWITSQAEREPDKEPASA